MHSGGNASSLPLVGGAPEPTINQLSKPGRRASRFPKLDVPVTEINNQAIRIDKPSLPEVSEHDLVMHYSRLAHRNFAVDVGFYPLGSCTMKYNPRFADYVASLNTFANSHPSTPDAFTQGNLEVLHELEGFLLEITGMDSATFQPPAGASGELTGLLIIKKYLEENNLTNKTDIIVPDSAHGTNPASARMAGFNVVEVSTDIRGMVNIDDLRSLVNENTAGLMLTNPNTGGLFEENIMEISNIIHENGGLVYYDGANLNAIVFEYSNSANFEQIVNEAIVNATQKFIPSIVITSTSAAFVDASEKDDTNRLGLSKVRIRIEYVIPKFKSPNLALEVDINAGG